MRVEMTVPGIGGIKREFDIPDERGMIFMKKLTEKRTRDKRLNIRLTEKEFKDVERISHIYDVSKTEVLLMGLRALKKEYDISDFE